MDEVKVYVINKGRKNLYLRYTDSATGKTVEKSARTAKHAAALKAAGAWQSELREGRYRKPGRMTWEGFRDHYSANALPGLALRTVATYESTLNVFEQHCSPTKLINITTPLVTEFATKLRTDLAAESTIAHHLRHLKAAMRWAHKQGLLSTLPDFTMPKRAKGAKVMRGRPITGEEFDRMIEATTAVLDNAAAESWKFYLRCLWESGLRLSESLTLTWTDSPNAIVIDLMGRHPMLRIPSEVEKGNRDRMLPITPQFAALLMSVPESDRQGRVFKLLAPNGTLFKASTWEVSRMIAAIGKKANVVVDERTKRVAGSGNKAAHDAIIRKFASAHDLRRAFGKRWATKLKPTQLRELMRHSSITTTLAYYVGEDAEATADALWAGFGGTLVDTSHRG
jgi:integrase